MTRPADLPPAERYPHGARARYVAGCRCEACRRANREYARARYRAVRLDPEAGNPLVGATRTRNHLRALSAVGAGRRTVADVTGIRATTIGEIAAGRRHHVRRSTERAVLALDVAAPWTDAQLVPATPTWRLLEILLACGWTRGALAHELGCVTPALQLGRDRVTARTALRVERLYRHLPSRIRFGEAVMRADPHPGRSGA